MDQAMFGEQFILFSLNLNKSTEHLPDLHVRVGDVILRLHILHVAAVCGLDHLVSGENCHSTPSIIVPILLCPMSETHTGVMRAGQSGLA